MSIDTKEPLDEENSKKDNNDGNSQNDSNGNNDDLNNQEEQQEKQNFEPTAEEKYAELNDRFIRLYAEFENFRRRSNKERLDVISSANAGLLKDLLPVLDDFERAIINNDQVTDS
jgi:molecular chaperone GrpE